MHTLGSIHRAREEHAQAVEWFTKGAEAGLPKALLDTGEGVAAPDCPAAADWYSRAAAAGVGQAAYNLCTMYAVGRGRGFIRTKHSTTVKSTNRSRVSL